MPERFMDRLVDWRDFERFVRDLYARYPDLEVEHNVTEIGKSGAPRQIDVRFTHQAAGHTYVTLVECKRWKEKVTRDRIDVLAATMQDLNASKGVMFTTVGYEPGAEALAKDRGIDIFVVRDLTDEEWGLPGRVVWFWLHYYGAQMTNITPGTMQFLATPGAPPQINLEMQIGPDVSPNPANILYSVEDGSAGPNLLDVLLDARSRVLGLVARENGRLFADGADGAVKAFLVPVRIDFSPYPFRQLRLPFGVGLLEQVSLDLLVTIKQVRFQLDRAGQLNLAVAVENFLTKQRQIVTRSGSPQAVAVLDINDEKTTAESDAPSDAPLQNGSLMQVFMEAWVDPEPLATPPRPGNNVTFRLPEWNINVAK